MKKLSIAVMGIVAVLLFSNLAYAVNDLLVPKSEEGSKQWTHFFTPSFRTRVQFDDNPTASNPKINRAWEAINGPKLAFKLPYEKSYIGTSWQYTNIWYSNRPGDRADNNHDVDFILRHDLSDRTTLGIKQFFQYKQQPFVSYQKYAAENPLWLGGNTADNVRQMAFRFTEPNLSENADYGYYTGTFGVDYRMNRKISFDLTYDIEILDFMQSSGIVEPSLDKLTHTFITLLNYRLLPETVFLIDARYQYGDYKTIKKDYDAQIIAGGIKNRIGKSVIINGRAGFEHRKPREDAQRIVIGGQRYNGDTERHKNKSNEPFIEVDLTYLFSKATQVKVGYKLKVVDTEQPSYTDVKVQGVYGAVTHKLTAKTYLMFFTSQEARYYQNYRVLEGNINGGGAGYEPHETITQVGFLATQQLKPWMFLELGYKYYNVHSDFSPLGWNEGFGDFLFGGAKGTAVNASYTRSRIFSGLNIIF